MDEDVCEGSQEGKKRDEDWSQRIHLDHICMGDEKDGRTLAFLVARERATKHVLGTDVPSKSTGEWICQRLIGMAS